MKLKLRNKKTGEIITLKDEGEIALLKLVESSLPNGLSLWEEVKEPLIKDEKIREVIRLWTKINGATELKYFEGENCLEDIFRNEIHFNQLLGLKDGETYTAEELCGEEEE